MDELKTSLFINRITFLRPAEKYYILTHHYTLSELCSWSTNTWAHILGRRVISKNFNPHKILDDVAYDLWWQDMGRGWICTINNDEYPSLLREIADPPIVLYGCGNSTLLSLLSVSIVGTREPDAMGIKGAYDLGYCAGLHSYAVVSGLAYGIDIAAHKGVIDAKKRGIAVLGSSIDIIYPRVHKGIAQDLLVHGGVIISEIPPRGVSGKHCFISRNRIISGLSMDTIIVQAPKGSGACATAQFALEQGRNVYVHRAGIQSQYEGTLELWKSGATLLFFNDKGCFI